MSLKWFIPFTFSDKITVFISSKWLNHAQYNSNILTDGTEDKEHLRYFLDWMSNDTLVTSYALDGHVSFPGTGTGIVSEYHTQNRSNTFKQSSSVHTGYRLSVAKLFTVIQLNVIVEWLTFRFIFGRSGFQISARRPAVPIEIFRCFLQSPPGKGLKSTFKLGNDRFLPHSFQFSIHLSPFHSTLYSLSY
jgi:hypothetical protein